MLVGSLSLLSGAGFPTEDGRTQKWAKGKLFVIVATIRDVEKIEETPNGPTHHVTLVPHATLGGLFDPSAHPEIIAPMAVGVYGTSIKETPPVGSLAIVVLVPHEEAFWVDVAMIAFVPGGASLTVVSGWDDPRIAETLRNIQIARGSLPAAATQPATQPAP